MLRIRIVFLDFDGVLNSHALWARMKEGGDLSDIDTFLDPDAVARVNRLCTDSDADVVVSSTWRLSHSRPQLQRLLRERGFKRQVVGVTPDYTVRTAPCGLWVALERGHEIQGWLDDNAKRYDVVSFVILDDDSDMAHLAARHVKTNATLGLTDADVEQAAKILSRDIEPRTK
jgi:HAD domain in Swiss Army Knife RNA repair proteins